MVKKYLSDAQTLIYLHIFTHFRYMQSNKSLASKFTFLPLLSLHFLSWITDLKKNCEIDKLSAPQHLLPETYVWIYSIPWQRTKCDSSSFLTKCSSFDIWVIPYSRMIAHFDLQYPYDFSIFLKFWGDHMNSYISKGK